MEATNTRSSSTIRRPLLLFYTILAIFTFAYWEEIQTWYKNSPSISLVDAFNKNEIINNEDDYSGCFTGTLTPWHASYSEKALCTNNKDIPHSILLQHASSQQHLNDNNNDILFFASCQKCCRSMLDGGESYCQCEDVCSTSVQEDLTDYYNQSLVDEDETAMVDDANNDREIEITDNNTTIINVETNATAIGTAANVSTTAAATTSSFCDNCLIQNKTICSDKVNNLVQNYPETYPTKIEAQQHLLNAGHCIQQQQQQCTFCPQGMITSNEIVPHTQDRTCNQVQLMALAMNTSNATEAGLCAIIQKKEELCCPRNGRGVEMKAQIELEFEREKDDGVGQMWNMRYENGTFIGASEWYRQWIKAKNVRREEDNGNSTSVELSQDELSSIDHTHDAHVLSRLKMDTPKALEYSTQMKARYEAVNALPDYRVRGLGWIEDRLGMVLNVIVAAHSVENEVSNNDNHTMVLSGGKVSIFIVDTVGDMKCGGHDDTNSGEIPENWMEYHPPLTMWVRANGPEMFAGTALPHLFEPSSFPEDRHRCAWRFDFDTRTSGEYSIYVKALTFNGFADWNKELCKTAPIQWENISKENVTDRALQSAIVQELAAKGNFTHHRGLMAFKNYDKLNSCCEACTRTRGCRMWSVPGEIDECELYFDKVEDDVEFLDSNTGKYIGRHRDYNYVQQKVSDFPVTRRRLGQSHRRKLSVRRSQVNLQKWPNLNVIDSYGYPRGEPTLDFIGCGWSNLKSFESPCHYPSDDLIFGSGKRIEIKIDSIDQTVNASITSDLEKRACSIEDESYGNARWIKYPFPTDDICMPIEQERQNKGFRNYLPMYNGTSMPPYCWHRDHIDKCCQQCGEMGCRFIVSHRWMSDLRRTGEWFGRWENYNCHYKDMAQEEIQHCIDRKNISNIDLKGASVKDILAAYMGQKLKGIKMVQPSSSSRKVVLDTVKWPHVIWHESIAEFEAELDKYREINEETTEYYFITGFYFSSEREPHVTADRSLQFSQLAQEKLRPKGYKMINAFDATAAFTYDSDAQNDGLHIIGPPIRAIITKFFHHLCQV